MPPEHNAQNDEPTASHNAGSWTLTRMRPVSDLARDAARCGGITERLSDQPGCSERYSKSVKKEAWRLPRTSKRRSGSVASKPSP
jgi:hypothetical protein